MAELSTVAKLDLSVEETTLQLGREEDFTNVKELLERAGFDEATLFHILKIKDMADLSSLKKEEIDLSTAPSELLALLIKLFLFAESSEFEEVKRLIEPAALESFFVLDILRLKDKGKLGKLCYASVILYPVAGLHIASDRHNNPDGSPFTPPIDIVFPAINVGTLLFLRTISKSFAMDLLDLGTGSGVAALMLNKHAKHVVASDITGRSVHFTEFNRRLNHCNNVEVVQGDLYFSVEDRRFDRIVSHPPYVPTIAGTVIYRNGGETGDVLIRRIIEGLQKYLKPGGTLYLVCLGMDTIDGKFEERIRRWLGEFEAEFDIIFALAEEKSPKLFAREIVESKHSDPTELEKWENFFSSIGALELVYGALVIQRRSQETIASPDAPKPLTARTKLGDRTDGSSFESIFEWYHWRTRPIALQELSYLRPSLAPDLQLKTVQTFDHGELSPNKYLLITEIPFPLSSSIEPWIVTAILNFDGKKSVAEVYRAGQEAQAIPGLITLDDFAAIVANLIDGGFLAVEIAG
jgi:SAM-dependent methyltransferase